MSSNRKWQLKQCKEMLRGFKNILAYDFLVGVGRKHPLTVLVAVVCMSAWSIADLIRMSFDENYPEKPEWIIDIHGKFTNLSGSE